ncbi:hypothetical protein A7A78_01760 [Aequorivita soesokkakensis]|uniref:Helix-turn-helix domain-containing protein n=1 Tax=Aequorivita soesokkakensis TaxID=1385699 RepID=A0A1A9LH04_9FLAO|nr:helix-turn-helix domain-containing protein [Aequorivita soesokkakensis]OAD92659.1 hypothetical protein A7A78_01760 [Aequorivita soesokkakensis]
MESIIQVQNVSKNEFISIIEKVIEEKLIQHLQPKQSENLTVKETAEVLKVSEQSIHNYIKRGIIPAQKAGRILLIKRSDLDKALTEVKTLKYKRS